MSWLLVLSCCGNGLLAVASAAGATQHTAESLIVQIDSQFSGEGAEGGAGIVVGYEYGYLYVLTANHVVRRDMESATEVTVRFRFWRQEAVPAEVLDIVEDKRDLAVVRLRLDSISVPNQLVEGLEAVEDGGSMALRRGDRVYPIGHPQGRPWFVPVDPQPVVEALVNEFRVEYSCEGGFSGGGIFDDQWRLRGMVQRFDGKLCLGLDFTTIRQVAEDQWEIPMNLVAAGPPATGNSGASRGSEPVRTGPRIVVVLVDGPDPKLAELAKKLIDAQVSKLPGVALVERERLDALLGEYELSRFFGEDDELASSFGGKLGADLMLFGSLGDARVERRAFKGYGIDGVADHYSMDLGFRLVNVGSHRVVYAGTFESRDRELYRDASTAPKQAMDRGSSLVHKVAEAAEAELSSALSKVD